MSESHEKIGNKQLYTLNFIYVNIKARQIIYGIICQPSDYFWWDVVTQREDEGGPGVLRCSVS